VSAADAMCPLPLDCSEVYGELTIDDWSLHGPAWCAHDLSPLYESPELRGENVLVESLAGRIARPMLTDETEYALRMMFSGATDRTGTPYVNAPGGLHANRRAFTERLIDPIRNGTASLAAELVIPDENGDPITLLFDVQPLRLEWRLLPNAYARAVLELRVPVPEFTEEYA